MSDITHPQALFGSAIYDSPVYSEEEIFGSPQVFKTTVGWWPVREFHHQPSSLEGSPKKHIWNMDRYEDTIDSWWLVDD